MSAYSVELGDWLLRCNAGEGLSGCAARHVLPFVAAPLARASDAAYGVPRRSDMDFMFSFFTRLAGDALSMSDLDFCSQSTFRTYVDKMCSHADSGWRRVSLPVKVEGFPHLQARRCAPACPFSFLRVACDCCARNNRSHWSRPLPLLRSCQTWSWCTETLWPCCAPS